MKKIWISLTILVAAFALAACSVVPESVFAGDLEPERQTEAPELGDATPTGKVEATLNDAETSLTITGSYAGLTGDATMAHIHLGEEGISGGVVCDLTFTNTGDDSNGGTLSGNCPVKVDEPDPVANKTINLEGLRGGDYYVNVHTEANPAGEVRAQLE